MISEIMTIARDALAGCPEFITRINDAGVNPIDRVQFIRNEQDLPADNKMARPFVLIDFPKIAWTRDLGDDCMSESSTFVVDIWDDADEKSATDDSLREINLIEAILRCITESRLRVSGVTEQLRPMTTNKLKKTPDETMDYWHSSYLFTLSPN